MSKTSFAVLTKARSKFGNRLTEKDYQRLLACQSVGEIMPYLKNNTHYSKALTDVSEREIHRGRLEALLKQNLFYEFDSLCRYDSSVSSGLSSYLILLSSNSTDKFIYQFPGYISKHTEIDVNKLANAKNYEEFLNATQSSQFYDILKQFSPDEKNRLPISDIENKLYNLVFGKLTKLIKATTKGQEKHELIMISKQTSCLITQISAKRPLT